MSANEQGPKPLLTFQQAANRGGFSKRTIRRLVERGEIRVITIGRLRRIAPQDLEACFEKHKSPK